MTMIMSMMIIIIIKLKVFKNFCLDVRVVEGDLVLGSNVGISGSKPAKGMHVYPCFTVLSCWPRLESTRGINVFQNPQHYKINYLSCTSQKE
jgi:hypothetical protein